MTMMNRFAALLERRISNWIAVFGCMFFGWTLYSAYENTIDHFTGGWHAAALTAAGAAGAALIVWLSRFVSAFWYGALLVLLIVGLRLIWVLTADTQPVSDFLDMHAGALSAAAGDFSFGRNDYFSRWTYQLGFTLFQALVIKSFGPSLLVLQLFNMLFQTVTALLLYRTAAIAFNETSGRAAALLYAVYVPNIIMCSVLTNQHISVFFFFAGLYVFIRYGPEGKQSWWLAGLCLGIGNLMRPMGSFFIVGLVAYAILFKLIPSIRNKGWPRLALRVLGLLAVYTVLQQGASYALQQTGVSPYPLSSQEPYWKFMVGLNPDTKGAWSSEDTEYVLRFPIGEERNRAELELFRERLEDKRQLADLFAHKAKTMWGAEDTAPYWSMPDQDRPGLQRKLIQIERIQYVTLAMFGLLAAAAAAVRGVSGEAALFMLLLLGYAALHLVIEIQTRYRFDILPCMFILAGYGVYLLRRPIAQKKVGLQ